VKAGRISISSPIARALIGKEVGDAIEVNAPGGARGYEIVGLPAAGATAGGDPPQPRRDRAGPHGNLACSAQFRDEDCDLRA
jgi:hypothetical protein